MIKPVVLVTAAEKSARLADFTKKILRDGGADVDYLPTEADEEADLIDALSRRPYNAILMRGLVAPTRKVMEAAPHLKIISKHGSGVEKVDLDAATERGVLVVNSGGANADAVAEVCLALMLSLARELPRLDANLRKGIWEKPTYVGHEFRGRIVGIVGHGQIGRRTARLAAAMGARVVIYSRSPVKDAGDAEIETDFEQLLRRADILSLHCAVNEQTLGMINRRTLGLMKRGALLINTGRGELVDEPALIEALQSGQLGGAGLDVFAQEPADPASPLFKLDNVIGCPHTAASTAESMIRTGTIAANNIIDYIKHGKYERAHVQNPALLERLG